MFALGLRKLIKGMLLRGSLLSIFVYETKKFIKERSKGRQRKKIREIFCIRLRKFRSGMFSGGTLIGIFFSKKPTTKIPKTFPIRKRKNIRENSPLDHGSLGNKCSKDRFFKVKKAIKNLRTLIRKREKKM